MPINKPASFSDPAVQAALRAAAGANDDYRAIVCVFLAGGNDSHNMIPPRQGTVNHAAYYAARTTYNTDGSVQSSIAVAPGSELPLTSEWGLHPNATKLKALWDAGKLAPLMNVGYMREPVNRTTFLNRQATRPEQLFSHNTQQEFWRTVPPFGGLPITGWMGRANDLADEYYNLSPYGDIPSTFSIAGRVSQMQGYESSSSDMQTTGPTTITGGDSLSIGGATATAFAAAFPAARGLAPWGNVYQDSMAARVAAAVTSQAALAAQLQNLPTTIAPGESVTTEARFTALASNSLAQQLKAVARIVHSRSNFVQRRQMFYVTLGGWDDHDGIAAKYGPRITQVDDALAAFYYAMRDIGMHNNVTLFTVSEFGRALKRNNDGTDHGWGGHSLVLGGSVNGGAIYGTPPDLRYGSSTDAGDGRLIPTTSVEQYVGTMLNWWGIPGSVLPVLLENSGRFSPAVIPGLLKEPVKASSATPVRSYDFSKGTLPPGLVNNITDAGPRTYYDKNGRLRVAGVNLCPNSRMVGADVASGALPPGYTRSAYAGFTHTLVGAGTDGDGDPYIDIRIQGTNATGAPAYPHIHMGLAVPAQGRWRAMLSAKVGIVKGALTSGQSVSLGIVYLNNSSYVNESNSGIRHNWGNAGTPQGYAFRTAYGAPATYSNQYRPQINISVPNGTTMDITIRIARPQLEWMLAPFGHDEQPGTYIPTTGTKIELPRFQYDPRNGRYLGYFRQQLGQNRITNSCFVGAAVGTPGTGPTGHAGMTGGGVGIVQSIVAVGVEDGMPYMDIRLQGTTAAPAEWAFAPSVVYAAANGQNWVAQAHVRLVGGSLNNVSTFTWEVMSRTAGATTRGKSVSLMGITKAPLRNQRFVAPLLFIDAGVDGVDTRFRLNVVANQRVDVTFRLGGLQLHNEARPAPFVPTYGDWASVADVEQVLAPDFSAPLTAATMLARFAQEPDYASVTQDTFHPVVTLSDGTVSNRMVMMSRSLPSYPASEGKTGVRVDAAGSYVAEPIAGPALAARQTGTRVSMVALNDVQQACLGVLGTQDTSAPVPSNVTKLTFGANGVYYQRIDIYDSRLPDEVGRLMSA